MSASRAKPKAKAPTLWAGRGKSTSHRGSLLGGVFALFLASLAYLLALSTIRWAMPLKLVGVVCLLMAIGLVFLGLRSILRLVLRIGLRGLLIRLAIVYLLAVLVGGLVGQSGQQGASHWLTTASGVFGWAGDRFADLGGFLSRAPDAVSFAATGQREPVRIPGVEWEDNLPPTPISINTVADEPRPTAILVPTAASIPTAVSQQPRELRIGSSVRVQGTDGERLNARSTPSTDAPIVAKFTEDAVLQIIEGPVKVDGRIWWKVEGAEGEGWCVADFITLP